VTLSQLFQVFNSSTLDIHLYLQLLSAQNHVGSCQLEQTFHLDLLFFTVASSYFLIFVIVQSLWYTMRLWMVHCFASLMPSQFQVWTWGVLYPSVISSYVCHSIQISVLHFFFGLCVLGGGGAFLFLLYFFCYF